MRMCIVSIALHLLACSGASTVRGTADRAIVQPDPPRELAPTPEVEPERVLGFGVESVGGDARLFALFPPEPETVTEQAELTDSARHCLSMHYPKPLETAPLRSRGHALGMQCQDVGATGVGCAGASETPAMVFGSGFVSVCRRVDTLEPSIEAIIERSGPDLARAISLLIDQVGISRVRSAQLLRDRTEEPGFDVLSLHYEASLEDPVDLARALADMLGARGVDEFTYHLDDGPVRLMITAHTLLNRVEVAVHIDHGG